MEMVKIQEVMEGDIEWFETNNGLCNDRLDIRKELEDFHASIANCEMLWGKKRRHNGFKYESCGDVSLITKILTTTHPLVY
jgi:hypothetical protein